jgi:threonine/homoserine/homoserine lactone efflux protein
MLELVLSGVATGLLIAILPGPVFFSLLKTSLNQGFKNGVWVAFGIALSDILYIIITRLGLSALMDSAWFTKLLGYAGGGLLIIVGVSAFFLPVQQHAREMASGKGYFRSFSKGFMINLINPFVLLFWISTVGLVSLKGTYNEWEKTAYFTTAIATIFLSDILKSYSATRISHFITPAMLGRINRVSGVALLLFGCRLLYFGFSGH